MPIRISREELIERVMRLRHPNPDILEIKRAYFGGLIVQYRRQNYHDWTDLRRFEWSDRYGPASNVSWGSDVEYRIKPGEPRLADCDPPASVSAPSDGTLNTLARGECGVITTRGGLDGAIVMATERHRYWGDAIAIVIHQGTSNMSAGSAIHRTYAGLGVRRINFLLEGLE